MSPRRAGLVLAVATGDRVATLPVESVVEVFRPLPILPVEGAAAHVLGAAIVRGDPVPVVDLAGLLGAPGGEPGRFVTVRAGRRVVALVVDRVLGLRPASELGRPSPLLEAALGPAVEAIGAIDGDLLATLRPARIVVEEGSG